MSLKTATITPAQARERLSWLAMSNQVGDSEARRELHAVLEAADEVFETNTVKMIATAEWLERLADEYAVQGRAWQAEENREIAARYRRCATRASTANDNALTNEAA